jgi:hypothetical protein
MWLAALALLASACVPDAQGAAPGQPDTAPAQPVAAPPPPPPEPPPTRSVAEVLDKGTVITISLASQQMHVFRDGVLWRSSPVSTGKRGKETPTGVFAILQKKTFHRSNLYSNAPMPFMQRLTWDGIAIHAGRLPGYPASHGCIRVPRAFASELYAITSPARTAVIVTDAPLAEAGAALALARATDALVPIAPDLLKRERRALAEAQLPSQPQPQPQAPERLPAARSIPLPQPAPSAAPAPGQPAQTIQLAAALSRESAAEQWADLAARRPELRGMHMTIIPAVVNGTQYYRLRVSSANAHQTCSGLKRAGIACFAVK